MPGPPTLPYYLLVLVYLVHTSSAIQLAVEPSNPVRGGLLKLAWTRAEGPVSMILYDAQKDKVAMEIADNLQGIKGSFGWEVAEVLPDGLYLVCIEDSVGADRSIDIILREHDHAHGIAQNKGRTPSTSLHVPASVASQTSADGGEEDDDNNDLGDEEGGRGDEGKDTFLVEIGLGVTALMLLLLGFLIITTAQSVPFRTHAH